MDSLQSTGTMQPGDVILVQCPPSVQVSGQFQVWAQNGTAPGSGDVTVGCGVYDRSTQGNGPTPGYGFVSVPFGSVKSTQEASTLSNFVGQVPHGLQLAINNTTNVAVSYRLWASPTVITTVGVK